MKSILTLVVAAVAGANASPASSMADVSIISDGQPQAPGPSMSATAACPSRSYSSLPQPDTSGWTGWGGNVYNNRWQASSNINSSNVVSMKEICGMDYHQGLSATPVVDGDIVYYPTWGGFMVAVDWKTCATIWEYNVTALVDTFGQSKVQQKVLFQTARTSPAIDGNILYFGTQPNALLVALNRTTGAEIAHIQTNSHPFAVLTTSPTVYNGKVYIGVASREEAAALMVPNYKCCSFVGNMAGYELNGNTFSMLWNIDMVPPNSDWAGGAIWGSQPSIDSARSQLFIATGNVYTLPTEYEACQNQTQNIQVIAKGLTSDPCVPKNVYQESVLAIDLESGFINWIRQLSPLDAWTAACGFGGSLQKPNLTRVPALCPYQPGPDADFGMAPSFVPSGKGTPHEQDTVVLGQKNGNVYALSAQAGTIFWATATSPDGNVGGLNWGIAVDDEQVFYTAVNSDLKQWTLEPSGKSINGSAFGSVSLANGSVLWETAPQAFSIVPPSVVNDVVFFGRTGNGGLPINEYIASPGGVMPVNKYTGEILKDYSLGATFHGGFAIVDDYVMFGTGYEPPYNGTGRFSVWTLM